jgi:hypothetical protein
LVIEVALRQLDAAISKIAGTLGERIANECSHRDSCPK